MACCLGILQAAGEPGGGGTRARSPRPQHRERQEDKGGRVGPGVRGGALPIVETWAPPRPLQPRTGPVGSGGTAVTNLLPLSSLSCLSVFSPGFLSACGCLFSSPCLLLLGDGG